MEFVKEYTCILRAYKNRTPLERVAMQATIVMPSLLLQKPHARAGSKEFSQHLTWRLSQWKAGRINELLDEVCTIQSQLPELDWQQGRTTQNLNRRIALLMSKGEVHSAISLITELSSEVQDALKRKHPKVEPANADALVQGEVPTANSILLKASPVTT